MNTKKLKGRKILSFLLVITMITSMFTGFSMPVYAETKSSDTYVSGGDTITENGEYHINKGSTGTLTIAEGVGEVTLIGSGVEWDEDYTITSEVYKNLHIDVTKASGVTLTLKDVGIENKDDSAPVIDFAGTDNVLNIEGICLIDHYNVGQGTYAAIHVAKDSALTVGGQGTLYLYKSNGGAGFGGNNGEMNGDLTFGTETSSLTMFAKGTKQGALIGAGTGASSLTDTPGFVRFVEGTYNLIANSRGGAIGGAAGSTGGSTGTRVYVETKASVNINVDYSGAAVGGGGYAQGNDASGGILYVDGGSIRVYVDKNAANNLPEGYNGEKITEGINDAAITAERLNSENEKVYRCIFNTNQLKETSEKFTVYDGDNLFYEGELHKYGFVQEALDKATGEQLSISSTPSNWYLNGETNLYFYLTGEDHILTVNNEKFLAHWNQSTKEFTISNYQELTGEEYEITASVSPKEGATMSFTVNGKEVTKAKAGELVKVHVELNGKYVTTGELTVTKSDGSAVEMNSDTQFTMPSSSVTVSQTVEQRENASFSLGEVTGGICGYVTMPLTLSDAEFDFTKVEISGTYTPSNFVLSCLEMAKTSQDATVTLTTEEGKWSITVEAKEGKSLTNGDLAELIFVIYDYASDNASAVVSITDAKFWNQGEEITGIQTKCSEGKVTVDTSMSYPVTVVAGKHGTIRLTKFSSEDSNPVSICPNKNRNVSFEAATTDEGWGLTGVEVTNEVTGKTSTNELSGQFQMQGAPLTVKPIYTKTYQVSVDETRTTNGTLTPQKTSVAANTTVFIDYKADENYSRGILHYSYTDENGQLVEKTTTNYNGSMYFTMPEADVTVWMEFEKYADVTYTINDANAGYIDNPMKSVIRDGSSHLDVTPVYQEGYQVESVEYSLDGGNTWKSSEKSSSFTTVTKEDGTTVSVSSYMVRENSLPDAVQVRVNFIKKATVQLESIEHGTIQATNYVGTTYDLTSPCAETEGDRIYFYVTPEEGYHLKELYLQDEEGNRIDIVQGDALSFKFPKTGDYKLYAVCTKSSEVDYQIGTAKELIQFAKAVNDGSYSTIGKKIQLTADIDLTGLDWTPIAKYDANDQYLPIFRGTFDGDGHTIFGLTDSLFGKVIDATIQNVTIKSDKTETMAASIVYQIGGTSLVQNCVNYCNITSSMPVGGIIFTVYSGNVEIRECYNYGDIFCTNVNGEAGAAGIVMQTLNNSEISVYDCGNAGDIAGRVVSGGIVGSITGNTYIKGCVNKGKITAGDTVINKVTYSYAAAGGILGDGCPAFSRSINGTWGTTDNTVKVEDCYNTGDIYVEHEVTQMSTGYTPGVLQYTEATAAGIAAFSAFYNSSETDGTITGLEKLKDSIQIRNCYNTGKITTKGNFSYIGRMIGEIVADKIDTWHDDTPPNKGTYSTYWGEFNAQDYFTIENCYTKAEITEITYPASTMGDAYQSSCSELPVLSWEGSEKSHTIVIDEAVPSTCLEKGLTGGSHCSVCGEVITKQEVTPLSGHTIVIDEAVPSTCKTRGKTEGSHCSVCGKVLKAQKSLPLSDHTSVVDRAIAASCTKAGLTEGSHCSVCNKVLTAQTVVYAKGHSYSKTYTVDTKATFQKDGSKSKHCTVCGAKSSVTKIAKVSKVTLSTTTYTYNGKVKTPTVVVKDSGGKTLKKGTDYTLTYANGRKNVGTYTVKVTLKGNYSGTKSLSFTINPKAATGLKLTAKSKGFDVAWTKLTTQTTGYQIQYATNSKFTSAKTVKVSKNTTVKTSISKLTAKKTYYVRIRTYKTVNGKTYYSTWSGAKTVKTK